MQVIYGEQTGQGEQLIILHGLFGNAKNWASLAKLWQKDFSVHRLNARNHALSFAATSMNYQLMAQDVAVYMQKNHIRKAHIVGHSMGGKIAMSLADMHPDKVQSLTILDITNAAYPKHHDLVLQSLSILDATDWTSRAQALTALADIPLETSTKQFLLADLAKNPATNKLNLQMNLSNIKLNYANLIAGLELSPSKIPTLLLAASESDYVTSDNLAEMQKIFSNLEVVFLQAGHWIHNQAQADVYEKILEFCTR